MPHRAFRPGCGKTVALRVRGHRIPIVPAAILFDLMNGGDKDWAAIRPIAKWDTLRLPPPESISRSAVPAPATARSAPGLRAASGPPPRYSLRV